MSVLKVTQSLKFLDLNIGFIFMPALNKLFMSNLKRCLLVCLTNADKSRLVSYTLAPTIAALRLFRRVKSTLRFKLTLTLRFRGGVIISVCSRLLEHYLNEQINLDCTNV